MMTFHSKNLVIPRKQLREVAEARLKEAEHLFERGCYAGSMFLGGSALECFFKLAICCTLKLDGLPAVFKTHDLAALILYTGYASDLRGRAPLREAFDRAVDEWGDDGRSTLLYADASGFDRDRADQFLSNLRHGEHGVVTWLKSRLS